MPILFQLSSSTGEPSALPPTAAIELVCTKCLMAGLSFTERRMLRTPSVEGSTMSRMGSSITLGSTTAATWMTAWALAQASSYAPRSCRSAE